MNVDDHGTEIMGSIKKIEALGALKLPSGASASIAAVDDLDQATGRDLNLVVGQKLNASIGSDLQERIQGILKIVMGVSQRIRAPKTWLGSEGVNVFQVLCDLLDLVQELNMQLAGNLHGSTPPPSNATSFNQGVALVNKLKPITS